MQLLFYNPHVFKKLSSVYHLLLTFLCFTTSMAGLVACVLRPAELTITWTTESELDIIGFNLYRAEAADGEFVKVNNELIPPAADPFIGDRHTYVDRDIVRGKTYYYLLETIDRNGNATRTDPIALTAGG
ncbi:MAG: hypothetical protein L0332_31410 [Chloroflexi bacterium]|nr:hypothetical protein [Chloroflexota bacterium]MCI0731210.1 hypothetical protein [Chloroflexota bacterium]